MEQKDNAIVLALGGGGARGMAHIGVLEVLVREQIPVRAVVGTSIGAEIGALFAAGIPVADIVDMAHRMDWLSTMRLFAPDFGNHGFTTGKGIREFLSPYIKNKSIEHLPMPFAAVASDLTSGEEVVMQTGDLLDAVHASISYPGLLSPFRKDGRLLIDGGMVNPVPFDVARKCFGSPVVAVKAHATVGKDAEHHEREALEWGERLEELIENPLSHISPQFTGWLKHFIRAHSVAGKEQKNPGVGSVMNQALIISEDMLMQLRMQIAPPDVLLEPDVSEIGTLEFYRAGIAIKAGRKAAETMLPAIRQLYS